MVCKSSTASQLFRKQGLHTMEDVMHSFYHDQPLYFMQFNEKLL